MAGFGILVDYDWCTGCHSCEIACQTDHGFPVGQTGIEVVGIGPWQIEDDRWQYSYLPVPTDQCDLCADRVAQGNVPTCVKHCQACCMTYGDLEGLAIKLAEKPKQALYALA